jgi:hypothetical protein
VPSLVGGYAWAGIRDLDPQEGAVRHGPQSQRDGTVAREPHRVAKQIQQYLPQPRGVGYHILPGAGSYSDAQC